MFSWASKINEILCLILWLYFSWKFHTWNKYYGVMGMNGCVVLQTWKTFKLLISFKPTIICYDECSFTWCDRYGYILSKNIRRLCELRYFYLYKKFNILVPMCFNEEIHGQWMDPSLFNPLSCIFAGVEKKGIRLQGMKRRYSIEGFEKKVRLAFNCRGWK